MTHIQTNGRLEGDRAFTLNVHDPIYEEKLRNSHDVPYPTEGGNLRSPRDTVWFAWKDSFDLNGFSDRELWKNAIFEGWGTSMLVWLTGLATYFLVPTVS